MRFLGVLVGLCLSGVSVGAQSPADSQMWRGRVATVIAEQLRASDSTGTFVVSLRDSASASDWTRQLLREVRQLIDSTSRDHRGAREYTVELYDPMPFGRDRPPSFRGILAVPFNVTSCDIVPGTLLGLTYLARVHTVRDTLRVDVAPEGTLGGICVTIPPKAP